MNRFLAHTGARFPIVQAPTGWIARSQMASAACNAGGLDIIEATVAEFHAISGRMGALAANGGF